MGTGSTMTFYESHEVDLPAFDLRSAVQLVGLAMTEAAGAVLGVSPSSSTRAGLR